MPETPDAPACLRCLTPMVAGLLADRDASVPNQAVWADCEPRRGWRGVFGGAAGGDRDSYALAGFRCPGCGYVELRAHRIH